MASDCCVMSTCSEVRWCQRAFHKYREVLMDASSCFNNGNRVFSVTLPPFLREIAGEAAKSRKCLLKFFKADSNPLS